MLFHRFRRRKTMLPLSRTSTPEPDDYSPISSKPAHTIGSGLIERLDWFRTELDRCSDAVIHTFMAHEGLLHCAMVYMKGMTDVEMFQESVLRDMISSCTTASTKDLIRRMVELQQVAVTSFKQEMEIDKALDAVLDGSIVLLLDGESNMLLFPYTKVEKRSISEPANEKVIRGPRDSFIEDIDTNLTMIRRRIKSPKLKTEERHYGTYTKTTVYLVYIEGICEQK